ncbi:MAG: hypothetical protein ACM3SU_05040 [Acidobacteriota bacterium]
MNASRRIGFQGSAAIARCLPFALELQRELAALGREEGDGAGGGVAVGAPSLAACDSVSEAGLPASVCLGTASFSIFSARSIAATWRARRLGLDVERLQRQATDKVLPGEAEKLRTTESLPSRPSNRIANAVSCFAVEPMS